MNLLSLDDKQKVITYETSLRDIKNIPDLAVSNITLLIGDNEVSICFQDPQQMIEFCEKHNFDFIDKRAEKGSGEA